MPSQISVFAYSSFIIKIDFNIQHNDHLLDEPFSNFSTNNCNESFHSPYSSSIILIFIIALKHYIIKDSCGCLSLPLDILGAESSAFTVML